MGSIGASINWSITSWAIEVHICTLVLSIPWCHAFREHAGWMTRKTEGLGHPAGVSEVRKWFKVGLKVDGWVESQTGVLGCRVWGAWKSMVHDTMMSHSGWPPAVPMPSPHHLSAGPPPPRLHCRSLLDGPAWKGAAFLSAQLLKVVCTVWVKWVLGQHVNQVVSEPDWGWAVKRDAHK